MLALPSLLRVFSLVFGALKWPHVGALKWPHCPRGNMLAGQAVLALRGAYTFPSYSVGQRVIQASNHGKQTWEMLVHVGDKQRVGITLIRFGQ
jgi:uncharacterized membrane protein YhhN